MIDPKNFTTEVFLFGETGRFSWPLPLHGGWRLRECSYSFTDRWVKVQGREVEDEDVFHFNAGFAAQLYRVKINTIQLKESAEENKKTNDQVMADRQYQVLVILTELR